MPKPKIECPEKAGDAQSIRTPRVPRIVIVSLLPLLALVVLFAADVPIGTPGYLVYRYSPVAALRLPRALPALLIGGVAVVVLTLGSQPDGSVKRSAMGAAALCWFALVAWTFCAPPFYVSQHVFNLESPSHEGAFVREARHVPSIRAYVSTQFYDRLQQQPDRIQGTRVLSNPPGMTVVAVLCDRTIDAFPRLQRLINKGFALDQAGDPARQGIFARQLLLAILLTLTWGGALVLGYLLCRLWMPPLAAIAIGLACVLNPATVNFTPGKDPAQVLTVLAILYTGLAGYTRSRRLPCLACGAIFALSLTIGLVHIWVVLILIAATVWQSHRRGPGLSHYLQRVILPAAVGFALVAACLQSLLGWNIVKTTLAVAQRYPDVQTHLINGYWTMVGLPMFILFAGPMLWCLVTVLRRDRHDSTSSLGRSLVFASVMVMTFSYFFANNNETPRLWIPFLVLLPIGLAVGRDLFRRGSDQHRRICLTLIALQIGVSVLHWSMMDVRESEFRLLPGPDGSPPRMWG